MNQYEIRNEQGRNVSEAVLRRYYGNFWKSVMDRLHHDHDGYLMTIHDQNYKFLIYRVLDD